LKKKILTEYFNLLIYKDLSERFSLKNTQLLRELLKYLFTNVCSFFSIHSYYKTVKQIYSLSRQTISDYINFIQETEYFSLLPHFSYSLKVQKINPKKIISLDNGLRNIISFRFSKDEGKLAENLVGNVLSSEVPLEEKNIFYWKGKREVDFVIKQNSKIAAFNVCFGQPLQEREISSLLEFQKSFRNVRDFILITKDLEKKEGKIKFIPLWKWLLHSSSFNP